MRTGIRAMMIIGLAGVVAACGAQQNISPNASAGATATLAPTTAVSTAIPTVEATSVAPKSLIFWLPDELAATSSSSGEGMVDLLSEQIAAFTASEGGVTIEIRRKRLHDAGGIIQTLRTARDVAPGVIPDLTLIRREDLLLAVQENLVQPMEGIVPTAIIGELYPNALELGQVNNTLYGLPYTLELQHVVVSRQVNIDASFQSYLDSETPFLFPAARPNGLNNVFLMQYLSAGGRVTEAGTLSVNEDALRETLAWYEQAAAANLITSDVLNYTRSQDYRSQINMDMSYAAVVSSPLYLELFAGQADFVPLSIPTVSGTPVTSLDGWIWVMPNSDMNQQAYVSAFLSWMMEAERQSTYLQQLRLMPSQRAAMRRAYGEPYDAFITSLMNNITLPYSEASTGSIARAIQSALAAVLAGERTADEAVRDVLNQTAN